MSLGRTGPHVIIGDFPYRLDADAPITFQRPRYRRWSRSLFSGRTDITGRPGAQNLNPDVLTWQMTDFSGEGQKVLTADGSESNFYTSEGLDFRTPGEFKLLPGIVLNNNNIGGGGGTTVEGSAFLNVAGTSTVVNTTDRRLDAVGTSIIKSTDYAPGAGVTEVSYLLYAQQKADLVSTVEGSSFVKLSGNGGSSGTDFKLRTEGTRARSPNLSVTAELATVVDFYAFLTSAVTGRKRPAITCKIVDVTHGTSPDDIKQIVASGTISLSSTSTTVVATLHFRPKTGHTYRAVVTYVNEPKKYSGAAVLDKVVLGPAHAMPTVTVSVYNETGGSTVTSKTFKLAAATSARAGSIAFASAAATTYTFRVSYDAGTFKPVLDKVVYLADGAASPATDVDLLERGISDTVWAVSTTSAQSPRIRDYSFANENWTTTTDAAAGTAFTAMGMTHTSQYEYVLYGADAATGGIIVKVDTSRAVSTYTGAGAFGLNQRALGLCITQDRLVVLISDNVGSTGSYLDAYVVDSTTGAEQPLINDSLVTTAYEVTYDTTIKQRMVGTFTGARFFLNLGGSSTIYEADLSGGDLVTSVLGDLDKGAKATCITHASGRTFVGGQFRAETGKTPRSAIWVVEPDGTVGQLTVLRPDNPDANPPAWLEVWEHDLWILQGALIWRYSLETGGLFCEYQIPARDASKARALAVFRGHVIAAYEDEGTWVAGWVSNYRTAGGTGHNQFVSSIYDFGLPTHDKVLTSVTLHTDQLPAGTEVVIEAQADQSGTWTHLGTAATTGVSRFAFKASVFDDDIVFNNLQLRITPVSTNGTATPTVRAITSQALAVAQEEFVDLVVRLDDEDSSDHADGQQLSGSTLARNLWELRANGRLVPFLDGHLSKEPGDNETHLVRVEDVDIQLSEVGEGGGWVRLRLVDA